MRPIHNWRDVLQRAWSVRLMLLAAVLSGLEIALPLAGDYLPVPPLTFAALSALATIGAFIARFVAQKGLNG